MIDTDKYERMLKDETYRLDGRNNMMALKLLEEVKRLQKENKILAKYMDIVQKYDDALLADGDTDPRWSELYD
jgi:uncharacterized protein YutD